MTTCSHRITKKSAGRLLEQELHPPASTMSTRRASTHRQALIKINMEIPT